MPQIDLSEVPGLPASAITILNPLGVFYTSDLMRSNRARLASASGLAVDDIRRWQCFAALCEIALITPARASVLLAAGIDRYEEFYRKPISTLRGLLQTGNASMSDDEIIRAMVSARDLLVTGVLNGTVVTTRDVPLEGAVAEIGGQTATSDARGRFRITGLRLGQTYTLSLSHPDKRAKIFSGVAVQPSSALIGRAFKLTGRPMPQARLSALIGDRLPPFGTAPVTTEARSEALNPEDRYVLSEFYSNGDGKFGSLFLDFHEGRFVVRTYRVKKADLPAGSALKDRFLLENGRLTKAKITAGKIGRMTRIRGILREYRGQTPTRANTEEAVKRMIEAMSDPK